MPYVNQKYHNLLKELAAADPEPRKYRDGKVVGAVQTVIAEIEREAGFDSFEWITE